MPRYQTTGDYLRTIAMYMALRKEACVARDRMKKELEFWEIRVAELDRKVQVTKREAGIVD